MKSLSHLLVTIFLFYIPIILSLVGTPLAALQLWQFGAAPFWPQTQGKIVSSEIVEKRAIDRPSLNHPATYKAAEVQYTYQLGKITYVSDKIAVFLAENPEATVQRYPPGKQVTVYHSPSNPNQAVLENQISLVLVLFFMGPSLLLIRRLFFPKPQTPSPEAKTEKDTTAQREKGTDPEGIENQIITLVMNGNKIEAIKLVRKHYGYNLKEAKEFVEELNHLNGNIPKI